MEFDKNVILFVMLLVFNFNMQDESVRSEVSISITKDLGFHRTPACIEGTNWKVYMNTSLAAQGAITQSLQNQKGPMGSGKGSIYRLLINFDQLLVNKFFQLRRKKER